MTQTDKGQCCVFPKVLLLSRVGTVPLVGHQYCWEVGICLLKNHVLCDGPEAVEKLRLQPGLHN